MKSFINFFVEKDLSVFQVVLWVIIAENFPLFQSVYNFIVAVILIGLVNYINDVAYDYTKKETQDDLA